MRRVMLAATVLGMLAVCACAAQDPAPVVDHEASIVNNRVTRRIDATKHAVRIQQTIRARNDGSSEIDQYFLTFPEALSSQIAFVDARNEDGSKLSVVPAVSARKGYIAYQVRFSTPVAPGETHMFKTTTILTHLLTPYPRTITQDETQSVVLKIDALLISPYKSEKQTTVIKVGTRAIESYTQEDATIEKESIKYGPFQDVQPYTSKQVHVHFANNVPFLTMEQVEREVEISLWGNVAIEEHYFLKHNGAALKDGLFSRVDYQMRQAKANSIQMLTGLLPPNAHDIYYRDIIGNISTSAVRNERKGVRMEIAPRFPLFGGYRTEWYQGYNLDSEEAMMYDASTGQYELSFAFNIPYATDLITIDEFTTKVVLPEGAQDIHVTFPSHQYDIEQSRITRFTYLDVLVGRPVIIFKSHNVVKQHTGIVKVVFSMPPMYQLREPFMLVAAFFSLFLAYSLLSRVDLTLAPKKHRKVTQNVQVEESKPKKE